MRKANKNFKPERPHVSTHKRKAKKFSLNQLAIVCLFAGVIGLVTLLWSRASELTSSDPNTVVLQYQLPMQHSSADTANLPKSHDDPFTLYGNGLLICGHSQEHQFEPSHRHTDEAIPKPATAKTLTKAEINELVNKVMDTGFMDLKPEYYDMPFAHKQHRLRLNLSDQEKFVLYYGDVEVPTAYTATLKILENYCAATTELYVPEAVEVVAKKNVDAAGQAVKPIESIDSSVSGEINSSLEAAKIEEASVAAETKDLEQAARLAIGQKVVKGPAAKELTRQLDRSTPKFIQKDGVTYETATRQLPPEVKNPLQVDYNQIRETKDSREQSSTDKRNPLAKLLLPTAQAHHDQERMPVRLVIFKAANTGDTGYPPYVIRGDVERYKNAVRKFYCKELSSRCYVSYGVQTIRGHSTEAYYNTCHRPSDCRHKFEAILSNIKEQDSGLILRHNVITLVIPTWHFYTSDTPCGIAFTGYAGEGGLGAIDIYNPGCNRVKAVAHELGHTFGLRHAMFELPGNLMDARGYPCSISLGAEGPGGRECHLNGQQKLSLIDNRQLFRPVAQSSDNDDEPDPEAPPPDPEEPPPPQSTPDFSIDLTCQRIGIRGLHDPDRPGEDIGYQVRVDDGNGRVISYYDADGEDYGQGDFDLPLPAEDSNNNGWKVTVIAYDSAGDGVLNATREAAIGPCLTARCTDLTVLSNVPHTPIGTRIDVPGGGVTGVVEPGKEFTVRANFNTGDVKVPATLPPRGDPLYKIIYPIPLGSGQNRIELIDSDLVPITNQVSFSFKAPTTPGTYVSSIRVAYNPFLDPGTLFPGCDFRVEVRPNQRPVVSFASPSNDSEFTAPANINLEVNASDPDGSIAKVEFFQGIFKIGEDKTAPYQYRWEGVGARSYTITAQATDDRGASSGNLFGSPLSLNVLPPGRTSTATAVVWPKGGFNSGKTEIFVRENHSIYTRIGSASTNPQVWSAWKERMDKVISKPAVARRGLDELLIIGRREDNLIYYRSRINNNWGQLKPVDTSLKDLVGDPVVVTEAGGSKVHLFVRTKDRHLYTKSYDGRNWSPFQIISGFTDSEPSVVSRGANSLDYVIVGFGGVLLWSSWNGQSWSGPSPIILSGLAGNPVLASAGPNHLNVVVRGADGRPISKTWSGSSWGPGVIISEEIVNINPAMRFFKSTKYDASYRDVLAKNTGGSLKLGTWGPNLPLVTKMQALGENYTPIGGDSGGGGSVGSVPQFYPVKIIGTPTLITGEYTQSHPDTDTVQALVLRGNGWNILSTNSSIDTIMTAGSAKWSDPKLNLLGLPPTN